MVKDRIGKSNNPGRWNEKKTKKRWREQLPSTEKERNESRQKGKGRVLTPDTERRMKTTEEPTK